METEHRPKANAHGAPGAGYEQRDVNVRALLQFGFWMAVFIALTLVAMRWTFAYLDRIETLGPAASPFVNERQIPPKPRIQADPHQELKDYCAAQQGQVNSYGWIDQRLHVVRIPIDRAMDLVLKNGLPTRSSAPPAAGVTMAAAPETPGTSGMQGPCGFLAPGQSGSEPER